MDQPGIERRRRRWVPGLVHRGLEWIGSHEFSVLVGMLIVMGSVWAFIELADEVMEGDTMHFDTWAVRALRNPEDPSDPLGPRWLEEMGRDITALGGIAYLTLLTTGVVGFLWIRRLYGAMLLVLVATLGGQGVSLILKMAYDRPRPDLVPHLSEVITSSFPSGHSMMSTTVYLTLGTLLSRFVVSRGLKAYFLLIAVTLSVLVGLSRIYMGVHYPTDVLTGWVAGLGWAVACWLVARSMQRREIVEPEGTEPNGEELPKAEPTSH